jgi:primosomal protein N' (replication factor Y)
VTQSGNPLFVQIAIPVPLRQLFTYVVPPNLLDKPLKIGERVAVSFGPRQVIGVVLSVSEQTELPLNKLKNITSRVVYNFHFDAPRLKFFFTSNLAIVILKVKINHYSMISSNP